MKEEVFWVGVREVDPGMGWYGSGLIETRWTASHVVIIDNARGLHEETRSFPEGFGYHIWKRFKYSSAGKFPCLQGAVCEHELHI